MNLELNINGEILPVNAESGDSLLTVLRNNGFFGVKHGCDDGQCGVCSILMDDKPVNSCLVLAAQAEGHRIRTIEGLGEHPDHGWKKTEGLSAVQRSFVETGAIQCGFCTPAQVLAATSLLEKELNPTEEQVRDVLSGVLCRCTGYLKPVQAVLRAAAYLRGETVEPVLPVDNQPVTGIQPEEPVQNSTSGEPLTQTMTSVMPKIWTTPQTKSFTTVGKPEVKVDAIKLVQGKPAYTGDIELRDMLYAKVLHSTVAHANIKNIDTAAAKALPGVVAVLTWKDIPRVVYSTAGQSDPIPGPLDAFSLDKKVRFFGDRVAFVAAETLEIAETALKLIKVEYEELPAILDSSNSMKKGAPVLHDEPEYLNFAESNPARNIAAEITDRCG